MAIVSVSVAPVLMMGVGRSVVITVVVVGMVTVYDMGWYIMMHNS